MNLETLLILIVSTAGLVLIGYVVFSTILRALSRPSLLFPWRRRAAIVDLETRGGELLREPLSAADRLAVERALNTLRIPNTGWFTGPWSNSDPILDAEQDIMTVWLKVRGNG